jgi:glutamate--cysteine ligase
VPAAARSLTRRHLEDHIASRVFAPGAAGGVGIELEWFPLPNVAPHQVAAMLPPALPGASRVTFEPGGQLELSGPRHDGAGAACAAMQLDTATIRGTLAAHGVQLEGIGVDPRGARPRVLDAPRYRAMEQYFDTRWPLGRTMMRNTAAIQINLDPGADAHDVERRWQLANDVGPTLAAAFANSPFDALGRATGWRSARLAVWAAIDPCRTRRPDPRDDGPATAYLEYALAAPVMMIRMSETQSLAVREPFPFGRWLDDGHALGWPTLDDLTYHLTTLFPPVRPRGWFELRMIDALPDEWWPVAVAVTAALLDDPDAADAASRAVAPVRDAWTPAARDALGVPALREAAAACFAAALDAFGRLGIEPDLIATTEAYHDRYVARGRCPADDHLDRRATRSTVA